MPVKNTIALITVIILALAIPACPANYYSGNGGADADSHGSAAADQGNDVDTSGSLPVLLDLGADYCAPCRQMEPILEGLKTEYEGIFDVRVVNVQQDQATARQYQVTRIPLQIFFDANGNELFRHIGFYSKADILAKWHELGFNF